MKGTTTLSGPIKLVSGLGTLSDAGILLEKPGGYQWKYRDLRTGIRYFLETLGPIGDQSSNTGCFFDYLGQSRARCHYWIGEWYHKAFLSSGHFLPLIECLYHKIQAVKWAPFSKPRSSKKINPKNLRSYRRHIIDTAVSDAIKTSVLGNEALKFWLPGMEVNGLSGAGIENLWQEHVGPLNDAFIVSSEAPGEADLADWRPPLWLELRVQLDTLFDSISRQADSSRSKSSPFISVPKRD